MRPKVLLGFIWNQTVCKEHQWSSESSGMGGPGFDSWGRFIPKTLILVVMASLFGAQELRVSIMNDLSVSV